MRTKLTVKNPRPASPTRAPVRSGSLVARKAVRPAAPAPGDKPPRAQKPANRSGRSFTYTSTCSASPIG
ncbi:pseudouridine synthase, partial [Burkholderia vietnamiensis]|nr:pseudouridine synthase [Burkholderia vietnamiensis]